MHTTSIITVCSSCSNNHMITDRESGEVICNRCGRVISDYIETNSHDWHTSITDRSNNRSGIGRIIHDYWENRQRCQWQYT